VGPKTCAGYVGSFDHEQQDAATFANWGIDFVEEDSCYHPSYPNGSVIPYHLLYARMRDALNATGRPIVFYSCVQGQDNVFEWGPYTANLWRTTGDICAPGKATWDGMLHNFRGNALYPNVSGPGQWQVWPGMDAAMGLTLVDQPLAPTRK
jgi:alpha-galactosidase